MGTPRRMAAKSKVQKEIILSVRDQEHFYELMGEENKKLVVIDLYLAWCGECIAMKENLKTLWFSFDDPDSRLAFFKCEKSNIPEDVLTTLENGELSCKPRFVMYLEGEKKIEIAGPDFTVLEQACNKFIPSLDD